MDIDIIIDNLKSNSLSIDNNPDNKTIYELFEKNITIDSIQYTIDKSINCSNITINNTNITNTTNITIDNNNNLSYIIIDCDKFFCDIITRIKCNYKISLLFNNTINIYSIENISLPILFMIYTKIQFKIYFENRDEFINDYMMDRIKIKYDCYTLNTHYIKNILEEYKNKKYAVNNRGMFFENGIFTRDLDLD